MLEGCVWGAQGMDFVSKSLPGNSQSRQQSPKERPKGFQGRPKGDFDFERPYLFLHTFTAFGGTGAGKNAAKTCTLRNTAKKHAFGVALPRPKATLPPRGGWWRGGGQKDELPNVNYKVNYNVNPPPPLPPYPGRATPAAPPLQSRAKAQCTAMQS